MLLLSKWNLFFAGGASFSFYVSLSGRASSGQPRRAFPSAAELHVQGYPEP